MLVTLGGITTSSGAAYGLTTTGSNRIGSGASGAVYSPLSSIFPPVACHSTDSDSNRKEVFIGTLHIEINL